MTDTTKLPDVWIAIDGDDEEGWFTSVNFGELEGYTRYIPASRLDAMREALRAAGIALSDLGACDDPECPDPICVRALTKVRAALKDSA